MGTIMKNGVSYGGSGTEVVANPQGEPTATLQKLKVGNSIYNVATSIIKLEDVTGATSSVSANTVSLMWSDPSDVIVSGVVLATWAGTKVVRKVGSAPSSISDGTVVLDNKVRNQYSSSGFVDTGLQYDTTYYYRFFPYSTDGAITDGRSLTATPTRIVIEDVPTQSGTLTYDGTVQTASFNDFDPSELDVSGNTGTNAGSYSAEFTPKNGYCWSDSTTTAKTVTWEIGKATGSITLDKMSISLDTTTLYSDVTISPVGDGNLSVASSDTNVATVGNIVNNVFRVSAEDAGNATVTVSMAASTNYTGATATLPVTVSFIDDVLNNNTWAVISAASTAGTASSHWSVGDCKEITINGTVGVTSYNNVSLYLYILGFNHNSSVEGSGISFGGFKTALTSGTDVCLVDSKYGTNAGYVGDKYFAMNHWGGSSSPYNTNYGGWKGCDARYDILGSTDTAPSGYGSTPLTSRVGYDASSTTATNPVSNTLMAALPSDLRSVMKPITKYTDNTGNSSNVQANVTSSIDYLPLLSEYEVQGARSYANQYEQNSQAQYQYYANGNSKIKYKQNDTSSAAFWWLRSARYSNAAGFCSVNTDGSADASASRTSLGVCAALLV